MRFPCERFILFVYRCWLHLDCRLSSRHFPPNYSPGKTSFSSPPGQLLLGIPLQFIGNGPQFTCIAHLPSRRGVRVLWLSLAFHYRRVPMMAWRTTTRPIGRSHTRGVPRWKTIDGPIIMHFAPGCGRLKYPSVPNGGVLSNLCRWM